MNEEIIDKLNEIIVRLIKLSNDINSGGNNG